MVQKGTYPTNIEEKMKRLGEENKKLRKIYEEEFRPLIDKEEYTDADAFSFLVKHPEIKPYLSWMDLKTMYDYAEKELIKIKGLERITGKNNSEEPEGMC